MNLTPTICVCLASIVLTAQPVAAQHHDGKSMQNYLPGVSATTTPPSPYADMAQRRVKALSDQQMGDLKAGHGMSLALAAELNGYPGPLHVLELANALRLSDQQRSRTNELIEAMKAEAIPIGEAIIAEETTLDRWFSEGRITRESLAAAVSRIGAAQGELRAAHLRYHLVMVEVLSPDQIALYAKLRGYAEGRDRTQEQ